jgi:molecular chaperone IbpA
MNDLVLSKNNVIKSTLSPLFLGFDKEFDRLTRMIDSNELRNTTYPPYNIKHLNDTDIEIEIAVAGFDKSELGVDIEDGKLLVRGDAKEDKTDKSTYSYRGIAKRKFTLSFALADTVEVVDAKKDDGMLVIKLFNNIPENKKPRSIKIG